MPGAPFLRGDRLTLRTVTSDDHEFLLEHGNDPAVRAGAPAPTPVDGDDLADFLDDGASVQFLPCRDREPVGFVFLFEVEPWRDNAELGCWIVPGEQGEGYATEATGLCLDHAFDDLGLHKVVARVFEHNDASMAVLDKLGFQQEGRLREQDYVRGAYRDTLLFGLLADEHER
jgi:RimJ/RimL family protein N-acetyltransferase